jgi:hypothetical protein
MLSHETLQKALAEIGATAPDAPALPGMEVEA